MSKYEIEKLINKGMTLEDIVEMVEQSYAEVDAAIKEKRLQEQKRKEEEEQLKQKKAVTKDKLKAAIEEYCKTFKIKTNDFNILVKKDNEGKCSFSICWEDGFSSSSIPKKDWEALAKLFLY